MPETAGISEIPSRRRRTTPSEDEVERSPLDGLSVRQRRLHVDGELRLEEAVALEVVRVEPVIREVELRDESPVTLRFYHDVDVPGTEVVASGAQRVVAGPQALEAVGAIFVGDHASEQVGGDKPRPYDIETR